MMIRAARPADAQSMAQVYVLSWQGTYRGILPDSYLDAMSRANYIKTFAKGMHNPRLINLVAEDEHQGVLGFCTAGQGLEEHTIYGSEIYTLYISPHHQRQGIGSRIMVELSARLADRNCFSMMVQVLRQNPYRRFYEQRGGVLFDRRVITFARTQLDAVAYGWISLDLLTPALPPQAEK